MTVDEICAALAAPFDPAELKWKPQAVSGNRAMVICYVDARVIQDRLDDVLGVAGWQDHYECLPDGAVVCRLKALLGEEWITKEDVGGQSEQPDEGDRRKAAFSDALKRAAVKYGVGRYLYRLKPQWVDYDPQKRQIVGTPRLPAAAPAPAKKAAPADGPELMGRLKARDSAEKLGGALVARVVASLAHHGHGREPGGWGPAAVALAVEETRAFFKARVAEAAAAAGAPPPAAPGRHADGGIGTPVAGAARAPRTVLERLRDEDARLAAAGLCEAGALVGWARQDLKARLGADPADWPESAADEVREYAERFRDACVEQRRERDAAKRK